ncbi:MAG: hypothetical protein AAGN66_22875 [Acidobacteriota bacterium]
MPHLRVPRPVPVILGLVLLVALLSPATAAAADHNSTGAGQNAYVKLCDVPYPDTYKFRERFDPTYLDLAGAVAYCKQFTNDLPYHWRTANFMIHFGPSSFTDRWRSFTCLACVRYENHPGPLGDLDIHTFPLRPLDASIFDAVALYGGRVSRVEVVTAIDDETGEMNGGYEITLVNVDAGRAGVVRIDPETGEASVLREAAIEDQ